MKELMAAVAKKSILFRIKFVNRLLDMKYYHIVAGFPAPSKYKVEEQEGV